MARAERSLIAPLIDVATYRPPLKVAMVRNHELSQPNQRATRLWTSGTSISERQQCSQHSCSSVGEIENSSARNSTPSCSLHFSRLSSTKQCSRCLGKCCILPLEGEQSMALLSRKRSESPVHLSTSCPRILVEVRSEATSTLYHCV